MYFFKNVDLMQIFKSVNAKRGFVLFNVFLYQIITFPLNVKNILLIFQGMKYHCDVCLADCSGARVRCTDCADFDLCLHVCIPLNFYSNFSHAWVLKILIEAVK